VLAAKKPITTRSIIVCNDNNQITGLFIMIRPIRSYEVNMKLRVTGDLGASL